MVWLLLRCSCLNSLFALLPSQYLSSDSLHINMSRRVESCHEAHDDRPMHRNHETSLNGNGEWYLPGASGAVQPEESTPLLPQYGEKYSCFSVAQKTFIIFTAAFASTFSPFSSNIYYPAMNSIAHDLRVTSSMMNLTITAYMAS